jgi:hypothetical protein
MAADVLGVAPQVHLAVGGLMARMGMLHRAEMMLFEATSLVAEPHEA